MTRGERLTWDMQQADPGRGAGHSFNRVPGSAVAASPERPRSEFLRLPASALPAAASRARTARPRMVFPSVSSNKSCLSNSWPAAASRPRACAPVVRSARKFPSGRPYARRVPGAGHSQMHARTVRIGPHLGRSAFPAQRASDRPARNLGRSRPNKQTRPSAPSGGGNINHPITAPARWPANPSAPSAASSASAGPEPKPPLPQRPQQHGISGRLRRREPEQQDGAAHHPLEHSRTAPEQAFFSIAPPRSRTGAQQTEGRKPSPSRPEDGGRGWGRCMYPGAAFVFHPRSIQLIVFPPPAVSVRRVRFRDRPSSNLKPNGPSLSSARAPHPRTPLHQPRRGTMPERLRPCLGAPNTIPPLTRLRQQADGQTKAQRKDTTTNQQKNKIAPLGSGPATCAHRTTTQSSGRLLATASRNIMLSHHSLSTNNKKKTKKKQTYAAGTKKIADVLNPVSSAVARGSVPAAVCRRDAQLLDQTPWPRRWPFRLPVALPRGRSRFGIVFWCRRPGRSSGMCPSSGQVWLMRTLARCAELGRRFQLDEAVRDRIVAEKNKKPGESAGAGLRSCLSRLNPRRRT